MKVHIRDIWLLVALIALPVRVLGYDRQISVDELGLMTLPELEKAAYSECSERAGRRKQALDHIDQGAELVSRGESAAGRLVLRYSQEELEQARIHEDNIGRIRLVVRKQLNGEEPAWVGAYTDAKASNECDAARASYETWWRERKDTVAPTPKQKTKRKKGNP